MIPEQLLYAADGFRWRVTSIVLCQETRLLSSRHLYRPRRPPGPALARIEKDVTAIRVAPSDTCN